MEKRILQAAVALCALIPVSAGMFGGLKGLLLFGETGDIGLDSHFRYLSGILLAIGVGYWTTIPNIERQGARFGLLTLLVVTGGLFRAIGRFVDGPAGLAMTVALMVELGLAPALYLWQQRIARMDAARVAE